MSVIKAGTTLTTAYTVEADTTGALEFKTGPSATLAMSISASGVVTFPATTGFDIASANITNLTSTTSTITDLRATTASATVLRSASGTITNLLATSLAVSGIAEFPDGSVTAPSITNTGDTNTGIYYPAADEVAISTGGSAGAAFNSNGLFFRNRIINGDMRIDQRNNGASITVTGATNAGIYTVDRFTTPAGLDSYTTTNAVCTVQQVSGPNELGFVNAVKVTVTTAGVGGTNRDVRNITTKLEVNSVSDLAYGTANARACKLSFYVKSSLTGQRSFFIYNPTSNKVLIPSWSISQANTWERIVIDIPADTTGSFSSTLTNEAMRIELRDSCSGTVLGSAITSWTTLGAQRGVTGDVNFFGTVNATIEITGMQLETGSVATSFERRSITDEILLCQRYCRVDELKGAVLGNLIPAGDDEFYFSRPTINMRVAPTCTFPDGLPTNLQRGGITLVGSVVTNNSQVNCINLLFDTGTAQTIGTYYVSTGLGSFRLISSSDF